MELLMLARNDGGWVCRLPVWYGVYSSLRHPHWSIQDRFSIVTRSLEFVHGSTPSTPPVSPQSAFAWCLPAPGANGEGGRLFYHTKCVMAYVILINPVTVQWLRAVMDYAATGDEEKLSLPLGSGLPSSKTRPMSTLFFYMNHNYHS